MLQMVETSDPPLPYVPKSLLPIKHRCDPYVLHCFRRLHLTPEKWRNPGDAQSFDGVVLFP